MDIEAFFLENCPLEVVSEVRSADLAHPIEDDIFFTVENYNAGPMCALASVLYLAPQMSATAHHDVQTGFLTSIATYAGMFPNGSKPIIAAAILRLPRTDENAYIYFSALRLNQIDVREKLMGTVAPNWTFQHPRDLDATTWHYNVYLASLGEIDALDSLIGKVEMTIDATNTYALLVDLAEIPGAQVTRVLQSYLDDSRVTRGSNGPGASLGELVRVLLDRR